VVATSGTVVVVDDVPNGGRWWRRPSQAESSAALTAARTLSTALGRSEAPAALTYTVAALATAAASKPTTLECRAANSALSLTNVELLVTWAKPASGALAP
jgi:hypothetical protein